MKLPKLIHSIEAIAKDCGRNPQDIQLVAVTKGQTPESIQEHILQYNHFALAENKGQELRDKTAILNNPRIQWHFIGALQLNKIKYLQHVHLIHTIEYLSQAEKIHEYALKWGHAPELLIQVHNGETQKHGCDPTEVPHLLAAIRALGLNVKGLMVMAPFNQSDQAKTVFTQTALLAKELGLKELSMGMSGDYTQAIQAGATILRIGSVLFQ